MREAAGIAAKMLEKLKDGVTKPTKAASVCCSSTPPVRVILESRTALRGAAAYAEASAALSSGISLRAGSPRF